jgi:hypothetical protein
LPVLAEANVGAAQNSLFTFGGFDFRVGSKTAVDVVFVGMARVHINRAMKLSPFAK